MRLLSALVCFLIAAPAFAGSNGVMNIVGAKNMGSKLQRVKPSVDPQGVEREFAYKSVVASQPVSDAEARAYCDQLVGHAYEAAAQWSEKCCAPIPVVIQGGKMANTYAFFRSAMDKNNKLKCERTPDQRAVVTVIATCFNALFKPGCPE